MTAIMNAATELATRKTPFPKLRPEFVKLIPFDVDVDATYAQFDKGSKLYDMINAYVCALHSIQKSCLITPIPNTSPATKLIEKFAREAFIANAKKTKKKKKNNNNSDQEEDEEDKEEDEDTKEECKEDNANAKVKLSLGLGVHKFQFEKHDLLLLKQTVGEPSAGGWGCDGPQFYTSMTLFVQGQKRSQFLTDFCSHVIEWSDSKTDAMFFQIYRYHVKHRYWRKTVKKIARHSETIILPKKTWNRVLDDITRFLDEKTVRWYFEHGIPYKRNYLFYGVPGSGKTSLIQSLAGKFNRNLCFLQPTHPEMTDDNFKSCIQGAPANSLIVLEDIDALFAKDRSKKHQGCPLTFSGLLNGLDGVGNPDGQIFILTTNFVGKLDKALIRSGRVDLHVQFPLATDEQLRGIFLLFYPECTENPILDQFVNEIRTNFSDGVSMAAVQQLFIQNMFAAPEVVLADVKNLGDRLDVIQKLNEQTKLPEEEEEKDAKIDLKTLKKKLPANWKENKACLELIEFAEKAMTKTKKKTKKKPTEETEDETKDETETETETEAEDEAKQEPETEAEPSTATDAGAVSKTTETEADATAVVSADEQTSVEPSMTKEETNDNDNDGSVEIASKKITETEIIETTTEPESKSSITVDI